MPPAAEEQIPFLANVTGYHIGVRVGTLRKIEWDQVNLDAGEIRPLKKQVKQKKSHTDQFMATCGPGWKCS